MNKIGINSSPPLREQLIAELQTLRKGGGISLWKLEKVTALRKAIAEQTGISPIELSAAQLHSYLLNELAALGETVEARASRNAFAIGDSEHRGSLMERRADFAAKHNRHIDTIEAYENYGLEEIISRLLSPRPTKDTRNNTQLAASQEKIAESMVVQGLSGLYSLGARAPEILKTFGHGRSPYLDTTIEWLLLPSHRGADWYTYKSRYTFTTTRKTYKIGVVSSAHSCQVLIASGVVDDVIKFNRESDIDTELENLLKNCQFIVHSNDPSKQKIVAFSEANATERQEILAPIWQIDTTACRVIQLEIPQGSEPITCEYRWSFDLRVDEQYAYWYSPGLMYLNTLTVDISQFPGREKYKFFIVPFLGPVFPDALEPIGDNYSLTANGWIMQGHGMSLVWQKL